MVTVPQGTQNPAYSPPSTHLSPEVNTKMAPATGPGPPSVPNQYPFLCRSPGTLNYCPPYRRWGGPFRAESPMRRRFLNHFASATGTAPFRLHRGESAGTGFHRGGNRRLNCAIHPAVLAAFAPAWSRCSATTSVDRYPATPKRGMTAHVYELQGRIVILQLQLVVPCTANCGLRVTSGRWAPEVPNCCLS